MAEHIANFAVLAFTNAEREPHIGALRAIKHSFDRAIMNVINGHAAPQTVEPVLRNRAMRAHPIAPQPSRRGQFQKPRQRAVVGEQQKAFSVEIEPPDANQARQIARQILENCRPALRIGVRRHQPARLVIEEQTGTLAVRQRFAVDHNTIRSGDIDRGRSDGGAVDRYPTRGNPRFGLPPRGETGARDDFRDTLTGFALVRLLFHARLLLTPLTCIKTWMGGTSFDCTGKPRYPTGRA
jgi:hypothetical protein